MFRKITEKRRHGTWLIHQNAMPTWPKPGSQTIKSIEFMYYSSKKGWAQV